MRAAIDPTEIPRLLPYLVIAEIEASPLRVRYRLVGTRVVEDHGSDFTNRYLEDCDFAVDPIPHLDGATGTARLVQPDQRTPAQDESFARSVALVDEIKNADTVLLGLPLYNFGPPSTVKAWVDHIVAPGLAIDAETGEKLDKDLFRFDLGDVGAGYRKLLEKLQSS